MMSKVCKVTINGEGISAKPGDLLLDAALMNGIELPHDCRSGYCDTCRVRVVAGRCLGDATDNPDIVHACQTRVISDLSVVVERVPEVMEVSGRIVELADIGRDVVEVCIQSATPLEYLPGQYLSVQFRGYPARHYSPTVPLEWPANPDVIRFHIRQLRRARVSAALGRKIKVGHHVKLTGPFGAAYFRPSQAGRLVLISSGTGFAPIWAIAQAAILERPKRELVAVTGARDMDSLYMIPALCRLAQFPQVTIVPTVQEHQNITAAIRFGEPTDFIPALSPNDIVYTAGAPRLVQTVTQAAKMNGATCFADPFLPAAGADSGPTLFSRTVSWLASTN
jgi:3-phenylpropionate/trans-cinnamate dioxygenase ferredoxin reductase subunit